MAAVIVGLMPGSMTGLMLGSTAAIDTSFVTRGSRDTSAGLACPGTRGDGLSITVTLSCASESAEMLNHVVEVALKARTHLNKLSFAVGIDHDGAHLHADKVSKLG